MRSRRIAAVAVFALMISAFAGAHVWTPTQHMADMRAKVELQTLFPKAFGEWQVDERMPVQLISPDQAAVLNRIYNQTLSRTYVNPQGERIMLSVAYGGDQSDGTRAHRPEVCYPAQGFQITENRKAKLALGTQQIDVRVLMSRLGGRLEPITYWVVVGGEIATSGVGQKLAQLRYGLRGIVPDGMLVRISSIDADMTRGNALQGRFAGELAAAMPAAARSQVFGGDAAH
jgi:EpsI family protein